jgi:hypothetical protein
MEPAAAAGGWAGLVLGLAPSAAPGAAAEAAPDSGAPAGSPGAARSAAGAGAAHWSPETITWDPVAMVRRGAAAPRRCAARALPFR